MGRVRQMHSQRSAGAQHDLSWLKRGRLRHDGEIADELAAPPEISRRRDPREFGVDEVGKQGPHRQRPTAWLGMKDSKPRIRTSL